MKFKKQSNTWKLLEAQHKFFLDRNQGNKIMPEILRKVGLRVECHADHFADDTTADPIWLAFCASKEWIVITGDKAIETDPINRQAVIECGAKVFMIEENCSRAVEWASAIVVARRHIVEIAHNNDGPFFVSLKKTSKTLLSALRRPDVLTKIGAEVESPTNASAIVA